MEKRAFHLVAPVRLVNSLHRCNENQYLRWGFKYSQEVILSRFDAAVRPVKPRSTSRHFAGRVIPQMAAPSLLAANAERSLANKFTRPSSALALDFRRCRLHTFVNIFTSCLPLRVSLDAQRLRRKSSAC